MILLELTFERVLQEVGISSSWCSIGQLAVLSLCCALVSPLQQTGDRVCVYWWQVVFQDGHPACHCPPPLESVGMALSPLPESKQAP